MIHSDFNTNPTHNNLLHPQQHAQPIKTCHTHTAPTTTCNIHAQPTTCPTHPCLTIFECQELKDAMQNTDSHSECQQVRVGL